MNRLKKKGPITLLKKKVPIYIYFYFRNPFPSFGHQQLTKEQSHNLIGLMQTRFIGMQSGVRPYVSRQAVGARRGCRRHLCSATICCLI